MASLKYRIHFELADGSEDSVLLTGETVEDIRADAQDEVEKRGGRNPWSEEIN